MKRGEFMTLEISEKTQKMLQEEARRQHTSPDLLAERLIKRALLVRQRDSSHLAGTWSEEEFREFEELVAPLQEVVEDNS
jgi:glutamate/tyrosine decarboxylase-like PLP-dependent enzyme